MYKRQHPGSTDVDTVAELMVDCQVDIVSSVIFIWEDVYKRQVVVSGEKMFENTYEGIEHIYIRDFLSSVLLHSITRVI